MNKDNDGWKRLFRGRVRKFKNLVNALETEWDIAKNQRNKFLKEELLKLHIAEVDLLQTLVRMQKDILLQWVENMMPLVELEDSFLEELASVVSRLEVRRLLYKKYAEEDF